MSGESSRRTRRSFLRLAGSGIAGALLAGCAPKMVEVEKVVKETVIVETEPKVVEKEVTKVVEKQVPVEQEPVSIRVHMPADRWASFMEASSKLFETRHPEIKVQAEPIPMTEYYAKVRTMFAGGQLGDVLWTWHENGAFQELWKVGMFDPIDDLVQAEQFDIGQYFRIAIELMSREGKLYMLPEYIHPGPTGYHFNKDRCDEAGVTYVPETPANQADIHDDWTIDDFFQVAEKLQKTENEKVSIWGFTRGLNHHQVVSMTRIFGGDVQTPDGRQAFIDSPQSIAGLKWAWSMIWDRKFHPNPAEMELGGRDMFVAGRSAIYCHGVQTVTALPKLVQDKFRFGSVLLPRHGETGERGLLLSTGGFGITTRAKEREAAWEWVKALTDLETSVSKVIVGGAEPGALPAAWHDPRVTAYSRVIAPFAGLIEEARPNIDPWNGRAAEIVKAVDNETQAIWINKVTPEEGARSCAVAVNEILAKDPL